MSSLGFEARWAHDVSQHRRQNSFAPPGIPSGSAAAQSHVGVWTAGVPPQLSNGRLRTGRLPSIVCWTIRTARR